MSKQHFIKRVILRNYKSIGYCDISLKPLTYLVGHNGAGKSNFMDALHFVKDAISTSLELALVDRGGINEVRRRSGGHPANFGMRIEFKLADDRHGWYAFKIAALPNGGYIVRQEECKVYSSRLDVHYKIENGEVIKSSVDNFPQVTSDRLVLGTVSGIQKFRPIYDALSALYFYNFNPKVMREMQKPQEGRYLKSMGENIASVIGALERENPVKLNLIRDYLQAVVPMVHSVERKAIGPMETVEFKQDMSGSKHAWKFHAQNMSDGTLRALGVLAALLQSNGDNPPVLIGIEEPESALHPAAAAVLREVLSIASKETQVIVTSHSPDLLDNDIDPDSIVAVISEGGETMLAPIDEPSLTILKNHLFTPGELMRLSQLEPNRKIIHSQRNKQLDLFSN